MNRIRIFAAGFAALFFAAAPAGAVTVTIDGVVIFTQADVNAGGITPGDTPGFPASLLIGGSYRLGSPLSVTTLKNGIVVGASAVTLDLNGFKVSGNGVGRTGVFSDQIDTTVMNGTVRGFTENGVEIRKGSAMVDGVRASNNANVGILLGGSDNSGTITRSILSGSTYGILCSGACVVEGNAATGNGVGINSGPGSAVVGNSVVNSSIYGIGGQRFGAAHNALAGNGFSGTPIIMTPNACYPNACP